AAARSAGGRAASRRVAAWRLHRAQARRSPGGALVRIATQESLPRRAGTPADRFRELRLTADERSMNAAGPPQGTRLPAGERNAAPHGGDASVAAASVGT